MEGLKYFLCAALGIFLYCICEHYFINTSTPVEYSVFEELKLGADSVRFGYPNDTTGHDYIIIHDPDCHCHTDNNNTF